MPVRASQPCLGSEARKIESSRNALGMFPLTASPRRVIVQTRIVVGEPRSWRRGGADLVAGRHPCVLGPSQLLSSVLRINLDDRVRGSPQFHGSIFMGDVMRERHDVLKVNGFGGERWNLASWKDTLTSLAASPRGQELEIS